MNKKDFNYDEFLGDLIVKDYSLRKLFSDYKKYRNFSGNIGKANIQEFLAFLWYFENRMNIRATRKSEFIEFPDKICDYMNEYMLPKMYYRDYETVLKDYFRDYVINYYDKYNITHDKSLIIGKRVAALLVNSLWNNYSFDKKVGRILSVEDDKETLSVNLLNLYASVSKKIAGLYTRDYRIKISNSTREFLPYYNFEYLFSDFENLKSEYFNRGRVHLCVDLEEGYYTDKDRREYSGYPYKQFEVNILSDEVCALVRKLDSVRK